MKNKFESILKIVPVEKLQTEINNTILVKNKTIGIYISLNKTHTGSEKAILDAGGQTNKLFFIDCVSSERKKDDVLHIQPNNLELIEAGITSFVDEIKEEKFILIDSLATLLIYNKEDNVAKFVKKITEIASEKNVSIIAFSQITQGKDLLSKVYNFFDSVEKIDKKQQTESNLEVEHNE